MKQTWLNDEPLPFRGGAPPSALSRTNWVFSWPPFLWLDDRKHRSVTAMNKMLVFTLGAKVGPFLQHSTKNVFLCRQTFSSPSIFGGSILSALSIHTWVTRAWAKNSSSVEKSLDDKVDHLSKARVIPQRISWRVDRSGHARRVQDSTRGTSNYW